MYGRLNQVKLYSKKGWKLRVGIKLIKNDNFSINHMMWVPIYIFGRGDSIDTQNI